LNDAGEHQKQSALVAAVVVVSLSSLRNQRQLRFGFWRGRSPRESLSSALAPGVVLGAQPAVRGSHGPVAKFFVQRPMSGGSKVGGLVAARAVGV
jgi:hypothetical protein